MAMSGGFLALQARKAKEKKKVAELEDAFKAADTDGDGKLSLHEWMEALKQSGHNVSRLVDCSYFAFTPLLHSNFYEHH